MSVSSRLRRLTAAVRFARRLRGLPPPVAAFQIRARLLARKTADDAPMGALRPNDLRELLRAAKGCRCVVELGTSKAWTAISLALAQRDRQVTTYDPVVQSARDSYLALAPRARRRIHFVDLAGESGPGELESPVDLLFIDSSHEKEPTIREFEAWRSALAADALVVFDDYGHPDFPGVREAVSELGLEGDTKGFLLIHRRRA